jgi:hypothetical protein
MTSKDAFYILLISDMENKVRLKEDHNIIDVEPAIGGVWISFQGKREFFVQGTLYYNKVMKVIRSKVDEYGLTGEGITPDGRKFKYFGDVKKIQKKSWLKNLTSLFSRR